MRRPVLLSLIAAAAATFGGFVALPGADAADTLQVGVGRADITSPTGYYMQGWVRSDAVLNGVHTRIQARAIVLKRGNQKLALVAEDLNGIAGGAVQAVADQLKGRGFSAANIIVSASHTHSAPSGYFPFGTYNSVFMTSSSLKSLLSQNVSGAMDKQLYAFEIRQLAEAIKRADDNLAPGRLGWATEKLTGLTANRSLEAHLNNHGISKAKGTGKVSDDPKGYLDTIDPEVQVLRVDKRTSSGFMPVGIWSTFADHGTVNKYRYDVYNADHHGSATRVVEAEIRRAGRVPSGQDVVNAYGNTDEGDQSAGLTRSGPAAADYVGRVEAASMLKAWKTAGSRMTETPALGTRWTRTCFCGQQSAVGKVASVAAQGLPLFTGSEEGRGPLYDLDRTDFEGVRNPATDVDPAQGHKLPVTRGVGPLALPNTVPLTAAQIGERLIVTVPGEMSVEMGRRVRAAVLSAAKGSSIKAVEIAGLANEYLSYFVTPEEYDMQHYEGGSQMFGRAASVVLQEGLVSLTKALVGNKVAPAAHAFDPSNGISPLAAPFSTGASQATQVSAPATTQRLARAQYSWQGAPKGADMPLGRAFVRIERGTRTASGLSWAAHADDLGLQIVWHVDDSGVYTAEWEVPRDAPVGEYRFVVTANHYRIASPEFRVQPATTLSVQGTTVRYPDAIENVDITYRPAIADGAVIHATGSKVAPGGARDAYGNCNGLAAVTTGARTGASTTADPSVCG